MEKREHGIQLLVVPVTTRPPREGDAAVEIPPRVREHLRLADERCWIVTDEYNSFTWPGPDIRPIRLPGSNQPLYGSIPAKLFEQVRNSLEQAARTGRLQETRRTE